MYISPKKKVFFILSSFRAGGAERVFWLLSQKFNKSAYDVSIVLLGSEDAFFSRDLPGIEVIDLNTVRASKSFFKLCNLLKTEKPSAVFTTGGQINLLVGFISLFIKIPQIIARPTNQDNSKYLTFKAKMLGLIANALYMRFDKIICQSEEIRIFVGEKQKISGHKMVVIPNPVLSNNIIRKVPNQEVKRLIVVARLTAQKGISRLLQMMAGLPLHYQLTIVGDGTLRVDIENQILALQLTQRVTMLGMIDNVLEVISEHDVFVLPSYIEGFPNVVIESLSVGTPVVSFRVGGISQIVVNDFNGFIIEQDDIDGFINKVTVACEKVWDSKQIRSDIYERFGIEKITLCYEKLVP